MVELQFQINNSQLEIKGINSYATFFGTNHANFQSLSRTLLLTCYNSSNRSNALGLATSQTSTSGFGVKNLQFAVE